ncbi:MAG: anthranilate phosphoribosyltransferase [Gemmatimonadota bacterium]
MRRWIEKAVAGEALTADEAEAAFDRFMDGSASAVEMAAFLTALKVRGETPDELAGGVRALRKVMVEVKLPSDDLVDTCGTGGGSFTTFNISTAAALVAAGGGVGIAKHGNRSFSSRCGSADVLEALGVRIDLGPEALERLFREVRFAFIYAPRMHPAMRNVAEVRRALGVATMMNLLGPLTSPARVRRQVVGVPGLERLQLVASALQELGHTRALVVHGEPGLDELSPLGPTHIVSVDAGRLEKFTLHPGDLGWSGFSADELAGGSPEDNAAVLEGVLAGRIGGAARAAVELNAAAAFWVAGRVDDLSAGVERAARTIEKGAAREALEKLREASARLAVDSE